MTDSQLSTQRPLTHASVPSDPSAEGRDRYIDLLRAGAILAVVVGHWLVAGVSVGDDGRPVAVNVLEPVAALRPLTWLFQVMPLFFIAGGVANAGSLRRARRRGDSAAEWVASRLRRLAVPALWFVALWSVAAATALGLGVDRDLVDDASRWSMVQLWFLATYVVMIAVAPVSYRLYRRVGSPLLIGGALAVAAVDLVARGVGVSAVGWMNVFLVWSVCQVVGFAWADGRLPAARGAWVGGLVAAVALALVLVMGAGYSVSLVGVPGEPRPNTSPPSVMLLVAMTAQLCVVRLAEPAVRKRLARPASSTRRRLDLIGLLNARAMTVYLWHMTALITVVALAHGLGVLPDQEVGSAAWWSVKPLWFAASTVVVVAMSVAMLPIEIRSMRSAVSARSVTATAWTVAAGVVLLALGFARLTTGHLVGGTTLDGVTLAALAGGAVVTFGSVTRRGPR